MEDKPLISVIMSCYEEPLDWIQIAIDSILRQTYTNFEFIIINDNPIRKELRDLLIYSSEKDRRIKIISNIDNLGLTKSLNIGLRIATGKYIARMDADDISLPERFNKQVAFMEANPDVIVCGTNIKLIGKRMPFYIKPIFFDDVDIRGQLFHNSGFVHPSVFIRKSVLDKFNICYDECFKSAQDYKLWFDLRDKGQFANLKDKLLKYRISDTQITSKLSRNQKENRKIVSDSFKREWINSLSLKNQQLDKNLLNNKKDKILLSYYKRSEAYQIPTIGNLLSTAFSICLKLSLKERLSLCCKAVIGISKTYKKY